MTYEEFKQDVTDRIRDFLPEKYADAEIGIHPVVKNNDLKLDGLTIQLADSNIAPNIYLNHDRYLENKFFDRSAFQWIENYKELNDNKRKVILSHYPIMCYNGQYRRNGEGKPKAYMLYGHVHNTFDEYIVNEHMKQVGKYKRTVRESSEQVGIPCQMINCFCMFSDYVPLTLVEWIELDGKRRGKNSISDYDVSDEIEGKD